ncbi:hypothetical protein BKA61DRAFT_607461 [Leptodontidium sp. MPI-SDFR-AT-0119]|nr:hypothetical protein BKA61DRAFT_607461 [Leptodontidium sp. MPI-SDFR-AT-0119]
MASSEYWYQQIVDRQYPLAENSINFLWTYAVAVVTAVIVTSMDIYNAFSAYFSGIGSAPLNHSLLSTNGGLWSALVPETGIPNWSLLMLFTIWINVYMHRKYNNPHPRALDAPSHWTSNLSHTPFALLNVICFGSEPVPLLAWSGIGTKYPTLLYRRSSCQLCTMEFGTGSSSASSDFYLLVILSMPPPRRRGE